MTSPASSNPAPARRAALAGIEAPRRAHLAVLHRAFPGPFNAAQAAAALGTAIEPTRKLLAALAAGGWLARVRPGWCVAPPLDAPEPGEWRADPWIVAGTLFAPAYIGGWSAAEHWGLTEQLFNGVYVVTAGRVASRRQSVQGTDFVIRSVPADALFGTRRVWRGHVAVDVSEPHRTIVDALDVPAAVGGALHASELLEAYVERSDAAPERLIEYGDRLGRGTIFKCLGYLAERAGLAHGSFVDACRERISSGVSLLDPTGPRGGRIVSRWNLRVNGTRLASNSDARR